MRAHRRRGALPGQDRHAHRRLQPRRLLPGRRRAPARVRVLQRRHLHGAAHMMQDHMTITLASAQSLGRSRPRASDALRFAEQLAAERGERTVRHSLAEQRRAARPRRAPARPAARPSPASSRRSRRRPGSRSSSTPSRDAPAGGHGSARWPARATSVGQRAREHERLARQRPLRRRRALLGEAQPELAQVGDQRAHALVVQLRVDRRAPSSRRSPASRRSARRVAASSASIVAEALREVAPGDLARPPRSRARTARARTAAAWRPRSPRAGCAPTARRSPRARRSCSSVRR